VDRLETEGENQSEELFVNSETVLKEEHKNTQPEHKVISKLLFALDSKYLF